MSHHAYYIAGESEAAKKAAEDFASTLGGEVVFLSYGLFSVDDARKLNDIAHRSGSESGKVIIAHMTRLFHEAQNSLLKVLEEPPAGVTIILVVPSAGILLPTVRSRVLDLPTALTKNDVSEIAQQFLTASPQEREKLTIKIVEAAKSDKDEVKQQARHQAVELVSGLTKSVYKLEKDLKKQPKMAIEYEETRAFLSDLAVFMPLMYERSAPLKLIFEHILLTTPKTLTKPQV